MRVAGSARSLPGRHERNTPSDRNGDSSGGPYQAAQPTFNSSRVGLSASPGSGHSRRPSAGTPRLRAGRGAWRRVTRPACGPVAAAMAAISARVGSYRRRICANTPSLGLGQDHEPVIVAASTRIRSTRINRVPLLSYIRDAQCLRPGDRSAHAVTGEDPHASSETISLRGLRVTGPKLPLG